MKRVLFAIVCLIVTYNLARYGSPTPPSASAPAVATAPQPTAPLTPEQIAAQERQSAAALVAAKKAEAEAAKASKADKVARGQAIFAMATIGQAARDPDSIKYQSMFATDKGAMCVQYTATNAFNARVRGFAVITPKSTQVTLDNAGAWNANCAHKDGRELMTDAMFEAQEEAFAK